MGTLSFLFGDTTPDTRTVHPINEPIYGTVPLQHIYSKGSEAVERLPIMRKCLGYIADTINETEGQIVNREKKLIFTENKLPRFIKQPSPEFVFPELVDQASYTLFMDGNLRLLAVRNSNGRPSSMYVGSPALVHKTYGDGTLIYYDYIYGNSGDGDSVIKANSVVHRRRFARPGRPSGIGEFDPGKTLINTALHAQDVLDKFFANNMFLDLIFTHKGQFVKGVGKNLIASLASRHGGPKNAWRPIVDDHEWDIQRLKDSNSGNQALELMNLLDNRICTQLFGIDPLVFSIGSQVTLGSSLTYQNASNLRSQVWLQAVKPIARIIAEAISEYLPDGQYFQFDAHDFLLGSPSDRAMVVEKMALVNKHTGVMVFSIDEMRSVLGFNDAPPTDAALVAKITGMGEDDIVVGGEPSSNGNLPVGV